jgi:hypothetical protein
MHTRRLFNVFLAGLLVPFGGCDNVPEPKTSAEEQYWEKYNLRVGTGDRAIEASTDLEASTDREIEAKLQVQEELSEKSPAMDDWWGLLSLYGVKSQNPNAVCPFGEDRGTHVDILIQRFKEKVAKAGKFSTENPLTP